MTNARTDQAPPQPTDLAEQVAKGHRAKQAYDGYIAGFVEKYKGHLLNHFLQVHSGDMDTIMEIKRLLTALATMEQEVLNDIDSGRMAEKQLATDPRH